MSVYLIGQLVIHNREEYGKYEAGFLDIFTKYQGEILVVSEGPTVLEGKWPYTRTVVIRFPSAEEARRWYDCPEYQTLAQHRRRASAANLVMVEGLPSR